MEVFKAPAVKKLQKCSKAFELNREHAVVFRIGTSVCTFLFKNAGIICASRKRSQQQKKKKMFFFVFVLSNICSDDFYVCYVAVLGSPVCLVYSLLGQFCLFAEHTNLVNIGRCNQLVHGLL